MVLPSWYAPLFPLLLLPDVNSCCLLYMLYTVPVATRSGGYQQTHAHMVTSNLITMTMKQRWNGKEWVGGE
jgi:hypothetical protein